MGVRGLAAFLFVISCTLVIWGAVLLSQTLVRAASKAQCTQTARREGYVCRTGQLLGPPIHPTGLNDSAHELSIRLAGRRELYAPRRPALPN